MGLGSEQVIVIDIVIKNSLGLHARPASMFVQLASTFDSEIFVEKEGEKVNGKSLMGLLMLAAGCGTILKLQAEGPDSELALKALVELIDGKFNEE
ncbi:MAG: phosphocarrier protein HPr [Lentisphaerae bacterium GWF2_45_14]|nr:MAG: phosphocarrier protein HPr [Lentisphaerae bacterium GWF2_45_14]